MADLQGSVAAIFSQAQTSVANHRKNCVALYKLHIKTAHKEFIAVFFDMLSRVVVVKKGPPTVDRIVKFVAQYVRFANEKAQEENAGGTDEDTLASLLVSAILEWVLQGFVAKNKIVRYQTVHLVAEMIPFLGEVDEETYLALRETLIDRSTCDKESTIRAQAVSALARLVASEDPSELQEGEKSIVDVLLDVMALDPAADVRRAALLHVPLTATTLPALLARARDADPATRRAVYASVFTPQPNAQPDNAAAHPQLHPRTLTIAQREALVRAGLGDREAAVKAAAGRMVGGWFELILAETGAEGVEEGDHARALLAFLELFDVVGPGEAVATDALLTLLGTRKDLWEGLEFGDDYFHTLTPESAVLARAFLEWSLASEREDGADRLPVVTAFAFHVQEAYNALLEALEALEDATRATRDRGEEAADDEGAEDELEEELAKREAILGELLRMSVKLDYGDEIGRRKVYSVIRDMLAHPHLPPGLIERCLDVLKEIMPTERELIRVVVEVVVDLREGEAEGEAEVEAEDEAGDTTQSTIRSLKRTKSKESMGQRKERHEMSPEEAARADLTEMRCLALVVSMLERVHGNFEDNSMLEGVLADLIIPAVRRKELGIREKGLVGLGLCCLIAKSIAVKSLQLFLGQIQNAPEQLKFKLLQIVFDLMVMYDQQLWGREEDGQAILTFLASTLEAEESPMVQAVLCVGLAKLLLSGLADDPNVLKSLLLAYVSPYTTGNAELRQCLSYFFSVYFYATAANQGRLRSIFMPAFDEMMRMHDELAEDQTMVSPQQFGLLVVDWTDARKAADTSASRHVHAELAVDILVALYDSDRRSEDQEVLCTLFSHLHIEGPLAPPLLVRLSVLLQHIQTQCPFDDPTLDKAVGRFKTRIMAEFEADLKEVEWAEYGTPEMRELYDYIGIDMPDWAMEGPNDGDRVGSPESPVPSKGRKGKAPAKGSRGKPAPAPTEESGQDSDDSDDDAEAAPPSPTPTKKALSSHSQLQTTPPLHLEEENERSSGDKDEAEARSPSPPPTPKPKAKVKPPARPSRFRATPAEEPEQDSGDEDDEARAPSPSPKPKPKAKAPARQSRSKAAPAEEPEQASGDEAEDRTRAPSPSSKPKPKAKAPARRSRSKAAPVEEPEQGPGEEDEARAPSPSPKPKPKAKAPARRSRSKVAPEEPEHGPGDEDEAPTPKPKVKGPPARRSRSKAAPVEELAVGSDEEAKPPKTSKVKVPAKTSRSKTTRRKTDPGSGDEESIPVPTAVPPRKSTRQSRAKTPPPPPEDIDHDSDFEAEDEMPVAGPVTPPKNTNGRKRVRSPGTKLALPSPADKKRRKPAAAPASARATRTSRRTAEPPREVAAPSSDDDFGGYSES